LVRGIAQLGRGMNIETVAECVETAEVRDRLTELGVDCAQGFFFGRPKPFEDVLAIELNEGHRRYARAGDGSGRGLASRDLTRQRRPGQHQLFDRAATDQVLLD